VKAYIVRNEEKITVSSKSTVTLAEGDRFYIETAGGGGWGKKSRVRR
jgi:N-methylhydantoinase B/oxoprolinase/acetone carboxylase alpha subunit